MFDSTAGVERIVKSSANDVLFATTRGLLKPSKHLCLGLGVKSMTGNRKVVVILIRLGHCVNYHTIETLEIAMADRIAESDTPLPDSLVKQPGLSTGLS